MKHLTHVRLLILYRHSSAKSFITSHQPSHTLCLALTPQRIRLQTLYLPSAVRILTFGFNTVLRTKVRTHWCGCTLFNLVKSDTLILWDCTRIMLFLIKSMKSFSLYPKVILWIFSSIAKNSPNQTNPQLNPKEQQDTTHNRLPRAAQQTFAS